MSVRSIWRCNISIAKKRVAGQGTQPSNQRISTVRSCYQRKGHDPSHSRGRDELGQAVRQHVHRTVARDAHPGRRPAAVPAQFFKKPLSQPPPVQARHDGAICLHPFRIRQAQTIWLRPTSAWHSWNYRRCNDSSALGWSGTCIDRFGDNYWNCAVLHLERDWWWWLIGAEYQAGEQGRQRDQTIETPAGQPALHAVFLPPVFLDQSVQVQNEV